ncbi:MAG: hypothetical protein JO019_03245 [Candidatus Kaiserbacteria bacterium]|nr:hypothetical protein [Candidatus Kaiserbacteria bacterium]
MNFQSHDENGLDGLTPVERARLRNELRFFMSGHPAIAPITLRTYDRIEAILAWFEAPRKVFAHASVPAFALVLTIGVGTSYAAENALPGDVLYPIKIHVNEPVVGALATSDSAKADWNTQLVERRLGEAEQLAAEGKLTPVARADIQNQIAVTTADFNANVAKMAETDDPTVVAQAQSNLEASLSGHEQVLAALAGDAPKSDDVAPILATVAAHKNALASDRSGVEASLAKRNDAKTKAAAMTTKANATAALQQVRASLSSAAASSTLAVGEKETQQAISDGELKFERGEYGAAFSTFQAAIRAAESTKVNIDAQEKLKTELPQATSTETSGDATSTQD